MLSGPLGFVLVVVLVLLCIGGLPNWGFSAGWGTGYWPSGIVGVILLLVVLRLFGLI